MLKSNLKTLTKEIFDKMDKLQLHIDHLTKGLSELLNEDDIVSLPSYQLLKSVYSEYLNDKPEQAKTKEEKIDQMYNPLYAPSTSRRKGKTKVTVGIQTPKTKTAPIPKQATVSIEQKEYAFGNPKRQSQPKLFDKNKAEKNFKAFFQQHDKRRNTNFVNVFPELKDYYE